jgi:hypothetical protein
VPYRDKKSGIYCITTPAGSQYVGSSVNIRMRWSGHRCGLRNGKHRSKRLQDAWNKHLGKLAFSILEECPTNELNMKEQEWIDRLGPVLNTTPFVNNVWASESTREKYRETYSSQNWKDKHRARYAAPTKSWKAVDCSDGKTYPSMSAAARKFEINVSGIAHLVSTQRLGRLGVRFKLTSDDWRDVVTARQQAHLTCAANGKNSRSVESRKRMSEAKAGKFPHRAWLASIEANSVPVVGQSVSDGRILLFKSQREAAKFVNPANPKTGSQQICKACSGVKRTAYGFIWTYDRKQRESVA